MLKTPIRLDELLARDVAVQWFEGVALIQGACREILARDPSDRGFPSASDIAIGPDGSVAIGRSSGTDGASTAAHLLARMLSDDVPVRLRLLVSQATGKESPYPTVAELASALAYFERPDGDNLIRQLFERAASAPGRAQTTPETKAATEKRAPAPPTEPRRPKRGSAPLIVGAIALILGSVSVAWLFASPSASGRLAETVASLTAALRQDDGAAAASTPAQPQKAATEVRNRVARSTKPNAPRAAASVTGRPLAAAAITVPAWLPPLPRLDRREALLSWDAPEVPMIFRQTIEIIGSRPAGPTASSQTETAHLYSKSDPGVVPPRAVYPRLPDETLVARVPEDRTILELVIATDGLVERVKLETAPRDIHEFMLVSAAKTWQFAPATVNGRPVRFRHRLAIVLP